MKKKYISLFLVLCTLLSAFSVTVYGKTMSDDKSVYQTIDENLLNQDVLVDSLGEASGTCGTSLSWTLSEGGLLTISGNGKMTDYSAVGSVPWAPYRAEILSVVVQSDVTSIGALAFYGCDNLTTVTLGKNVESIGESAFSACENLSRIDVQTSSTYFKSSSGVLYSKDGSKLVCFPAGKSGEFTIPDTVSEISFGAFEYAINLTKINFGKGVSKIGDNAFSTCVSLTDVTLGKSVTEIGAQAFIHCIALKNILVDSGNPNFKSVDGVVYSKDGKDLVLYPSGRSGNFTVPSGVVNISNHAFYSCEYLTSVTFSDTVVTIGEFAFSYCKGLVAIIMGKNVKTISEEAFSYCFSLPAFVSNDNLQTIDDNAFYHCEGLKTVYLSDSVTKIGKYAFERCLKLRNLRLGTGLTSIGKYAFCTCRQLKSVAVPTNVTTIGFNALGYYFDGYNYIPVDGFKIYCEPESKAEKYAISKSFSYDSITNAPVIEKPVVTVPSDYYTVTFKDEDGTVISENKYQLGDTVTIPSAPVKKADKTYTYTFAGWDKTVTTVNGNATYIATYTSKYIDYTVTFKNEDGTIISENTYHYGDTVTIPSAPVKNGDETYTYAFAGWDKDVIQVSGNATYTATYTSKYVDYTVTFKNEDGTIISENTYHYGDTVTIPSDPTKKDDETYTYTFAGWDKTVTTVSGSETYTATYTAEIQKDVINNPKHKFFMDKESNTMPNVVAQTPVSALISAASNSGVTVTVKDKGGNVLPETSLLGTGCVVSDSLGNTFTVIVCGDVDGNSRVDSTDYLQIKKMFLKELTIDGIYFHASDANGDGLINSTDYMKIKSYFLGVIDLYN